jgi:hypothetical protein
VLEVAPFPGDEAVHDAQAMASADELFRQM